MPSVDERFYRAIIIRVCKDLKQIINVVVWGVFIYSSYLFIKVIKIGNILIGLTIFNTLQPLIRDMPFSIGSILEAVVSLDRIEVVKLLIFSF